MPPSSIGGGASRLADALLERGFRNVTVLDISAAALDLAALRLGRRASEVSWITDDVTEWLPSRRFDIWHDRAAFHFLVDPADRAAYVARLSWRSDLDAMASSRPLPLTARTAAADCRSNATT